MLPRVILLVEIKVVLHAQIMHARAQTDARAKWVCAKYARNATQRNKEKVCQPTDNLHNRQTSNLAKKHRIENKQKGHSSRNV